MSGDKAFKAGSLLKLEDFVRMLILCFPNDLIPAYYFRVGTLHQLRADHQVGILSMGFFTLVLFSKSRTASRFMFVQPSVFGGCGNAPGPFGSIGMYGTAFRSPGELIYSLGLLPQVCADDLSPLHEATPLSQRSILLLILEQYFVLG